MNMFYMKFIYWFQDSLYDTCLGNHCEEGEVCETLRDGKNVCVQDSKYMIIIPH